MNATPWPRAVRRTRAVLLGLAGLLLSASGCTQSIGLPQDTSEGLRYPIALVPDPAGTHLFALGANFDRLYRAGTMRTIDTATDTYLTNSAGQVVTAEVPSFGGSFAVDASQGATSTALRLIVPARDDDSLTILDVAETAPRALSCGADPETGICNGNHRIAASSGVYPVGDDPFAVALSDAPDGRRLVHIAASTNGQMSLFDFDPKAPEVSLRALDTAAMPAGLHSIAVSTLNRRVYVTSTRTSAIQTYRVAPTGDPDKPWSIEQEASVVLPASGSNDYGRGMAFSSDNSRLYVAWRSPAALQIVDVVPERPDFPGLGAPYNRLVDTIELGAKPSMLAVAPTGPGGRDLVYVSCYGEDAIWVVDPQLRSVVAQIPMRVAVPVPGQSPSIVRGSPFALSAVNVPGRGWVLYAALFSVPPGRSHDIVVVPLGANEPGRHTADHVVTIQGNP